MSSLPSSFGFVGLGAMGYPMAVNLRRKMPCSITLTIFDINQEAMHRFQKENEAFGPINIVDSARTLTDQAECILTIVPEGRHVKEVYMTPENGLLATSTAGKIFIDCSTIDRKTSLEVGRAVAASSSVNPPLFYDAPVSGGTAGAEKGIITFMVGAAADDPNFPHLKAFLSFMGGAVNACGGPSLGLAAKLSNNYLSGLLAIATSEAMNIGMRCGLDPKVLANCFSTSSGSNYVNNTCNPVPGVCPDAVTSRNYEGGFKVQLMKKDMTLAMEEARQVGAKLILGDAGLAAYTAASEDPRCRDRDNRVIYRWIGGYEPEVKKE